VHVPGWHEATKDLQKQGKVQMLGIIEEQHPDRARLFMQWKRIGWPVMVDSLNLLNVPYVPITLGIDEYGIIRLLEPTLEDQKDLKERFIERTYDPLSAAALGVNAPMLPEASDTTSAALEKLRDATRRGSAVDWRAYSSALVIWGGADRLDDAIDAYDHAVRLDPRDGPTHFRLGVTYRKRYDSGHGRPTDFQSAIEQWQEALDIDPNNYIWRRRIEQYGPRLAKPYPFYDWVTAARREIQARGDVPVALTVEPSGAEFAEPTKTFQNSESATREPDPRGRIFRDQGRLIETEATVVPDRVRPGGSARVHVVFRPVLRLKTHWNNEVKDLVVWVDPPEGWQVDGRYIAFPNPTATVSQEARKIEFEVQCPEESRPGVVTIRLYALYYVCEGVNGTCLYRRQDINVQTRVKN
jgi:tetratricopeptide (TPR) repeat protein